MEMQAIETAYQKLKTSGQTNREGMKSAYDEVQARGIDISYRAFCHHLSRIAILERMKACRENQLKNSPKS